MSIIFLMYLCQAFAFKLHKWIVVIVDYFRVLISKSPLEILHLTYGLYFRNEKDMFLFYYAQAYFPCCLVFVSTEWKGRTTIAFSSNFSIGFPFLALTAIDFYFVYSHMIPFLGIWVGSIIFSIYNCGVTLGGMEDVYQGLLAS